MSGLYKNQPFLLVKEFGFIDFEQPDHICSWSFQNGVNTQFLRFSIEAATEITFQTLRINGIDFADYSASVTIIDSNGQKYKPDPKDATDNLVFCAKTRKSPWVVINLGIGFHLKELSFNLAKEKYLKRKMLGLKVQHSTDYSNWITIHDNYSIFSKKKFRNLSLEDQVITASFCRNHSLLSELLEPNENSADLQSALKMLNIANQTLSQFEIAYGAHSFTKTFGLLSETEKHFKIGEFAGLLNFFNKTLGIKAFASSGSLLGIVRDGGLIAHDDDFDLCYLSNETEEHGILSERTLFIERLTEAGYEVRKGSDCGHLWCISPKGIWLDIFTGWIQDDRCIMHPLEKTGVVQSEVIPLRKSNVFGHDVYVPNSPDSLLVLNYGSDWSTPSPFWKFDWSRVKSDYSFLY